MICILSSAWRGVRSVCFFALLTWGAVFSGVACRGGSTPELGATSSACEDTAEEIDAWSGGNLVVNIRLDSESDLAADRATDIDDRLALQLRYFAEEPTDCLAADAVILVSMHVDLDRNPSFAVPVGRTCAYAYTEDDPVEEDPETGERYQIRCADTSLLVAVEPDEDEWAYINVACSRVAVESD